MLQLILKRASSSRPSGEWNVDDYDVLCDGDVVGRIFKANAAPVSEPWLWTLAFGYHEDRTPTHGYAATGGAAMAASRRASGENNAKASEDHQILGRGISPMTLSRRTLRTAIVIGYAVVVALLIADLFTNVFAETWPDRVVVGWFLILSCGLLWLADWAVKIWPR